MLKRRQYWFRRESFVFEPYTYSTEITSLCLRFVVRHWHSRFLSYKAIVRFKGSKASVWSLEDPEVTYNSGNSKLPFIFYNAEIKTSLQLWERKRKHGARIPLTLKIKSKYILHFYYQPGVKQNLTWNLKNKNRSK